MSEPVIKVENLSKRYVIGHQRSKEDGFRHVIEDALRSPLKWLRSRRETKKQEREEFWALKDVSFEVKQGEVLGIIGRNGAGKSTLLKILSRITEPTSGRISINGRIASLLEVGTGFHPELTGRENIYLNGAILGMSRLEIQRKFDEIVAFSEVEKFLDTPVKRYSSGMYVRLAFAVAAHLEPEILIVDEVLAVGDAQFQKKCLGKMKDVSGRDGRTVLFVSHNMGAVASLCQNACWLENGTVRKVGPAREVLNDYLTESGPNRSRTIRLDHLPRTSGGDGRLRLNRIQWLSELPLRHGEQLSARIEFEAINPVDDVTVGIGFATAEGTRLLTYDSDLMGESRQTFALPGVNSVVVTIDSVPLAPGLYNLDAGARSGDHHSLDYLPSLAQIEIIPGPKTPGSIVVPGGGVRLSGEWKWNVSECAGSLPTALV